MSKNLITEITKMLGVEIGEKFKVKGYNGVTYRFDADGLKENYDNPPNEIWTAANAMVGSLLAGECEVITVPWKPKKGDIYYSFDSVFGEWWVAYMHVWIGSPYDYAFLAKGWVYHSRVEAEAALPKVAAELDVKYKL